MKCTFFLWLFQQLYINCGSRTGKEENKDLLKAFDSNNVMTNIFPLAWKARQKK